MLPSPSVGAWMKAWSFMRAQRSRVDVMPNSPGANEQGIGEEGEGIGRLLGVANREQVTAPEQEEDGHQAAPGRTRAVAMPVPVRAMLRALFCSGHESMGLVWSQFQDAPGEPSQPALEGEGP